ncbi:CvpA family protein [Pontibacter sp. 172403-2]|nr:CvpA family protein [Pontibacter sp. 172403-2]
MNFVDILLLLILLSSVYTGWRRGFILAILDLIRWMGSLFIGFSLYPYMVGLLRNVVDWNEMWLLPTSFFIVTMLASILLHYLVKFILSRLSVSIHARKLNQVLGILPGLLNGAITAAIVALLLYYFPLPENLQANVQNSKLVSRLTSGTDLIQTALAPVFEKASEQALTNLAVESGTETTIALPYTVENPTPQPDLEARMLALINQERIGKGLEPLQADTALRTVARQHSTDMFRRGYFSHYSPEGQDAADRIRAAGIRFKTAGENLALAPTLPIAHKGLMNSPGHRANILHKQFTKVGIGVMKGGPGRLMITQEFRN